MVVDVNWQFNCFPNRHSEPRDAAGFCEQSGGGREGEEDSVCARKEADRERYKAYKGIGRHSGLDPRLDRHPTMAEIQFIVDKLNEPPFNKDLRLVRRVFDVCSCLIILVAFIFVVDEGESFVVGAYRYWACALRWICAH